MRKSTLFKLLSKRVARRLILSSLALLLLGWLPACSLLQKSDPVTNAISDEEYLGLFAEYGLSPHRSPDVPHTPIPFKTVAEARVYVAELARFIRHQSDGQALQQLELRYKAPPTLAQRTSLAFLLLKNKRDIFGSSKYQGYRYAVYNPNNLQEKPRILELLLDKSGSTDVSLDADGLPRNLYAALTTGTKASDNFTGYAFLYTDTYQRLKGKSYLNGQVFADNIALHGKRDGKADPVIRNGKENAPPAPNATSGTNGCVHWIDYYASDGTYITTNCLEYADYGSDLPWGGTTTGPVYSPDGGGSGGGGGSTPLPEDPSDSDANGIGIITTPYGKLPGQNAYVVIAYSSGTINSFDSGLTGYEGLAQWVHITGQQTEFYNRNFRFDVAFKVNTIAPSGYVVKYGTPYQLFGDYNTLTKSGHIYVPKYWD